VGLLDATGGRSRLASSLSGQLLPGGLASRTLPGCLLGACHGEWAMGDGSAVERRSEQIGLNYKLAFFRCSSGFMEPGWPQQ
jgi:hypothetical protein